MQGLAEAGCHLGAVQAVLEVPVLGGLLVRGQQPPHQHRAGGRPQVGVSALQSVEPLHALQHSGQRPLLGLTDDLRVTGGLAVLVGEDTVVGRPVVLTELHAAPLTHSAPLSAPTRCRLQASYQSPYFIEMTWKCFPHTSR